MGNWYEALAEGWPEPSDRGALKCYDSVEDAWLRAQPGHKVWLAARLAPGWPERVRLLAATARAVDVNLDVVRDAGDLPLDTLPDVERLLSGVAEPEQLGPREEAIAVLEHLETLRWVVDARIALARAWMQLADPARRSEEEWRETTVLLCSALARAYGVFRTLGPFGMLREADEAITSEVDWVAGRG